MKKVILTAFIAIMMFACKSKSATATKLDRASQRDIKGDWVISSVSFPGSDYIQVNSFQLADSKCFVGSSWNFVPNNNKGTMALQDPSCTSFSSPITWFVNNQGQFVLKVLNAGDKARKVRAGYVLEIANQSETSFQLVDKVDINGKMTDVTYQFQKN